MTKNEVAVKEQGFELITMTGEMAEAYAEEMEGLGSIPFEKVKIPSGGGLAFELPGENEEDIITSPELKGVILYHHPINAYWAEKFDGNNEKPNCSSFDGKQGIVRETGEIRECSKCPFNEFGSDGKGKACKNLHRCYILQEANPVPVILTLPPTSLRYIRDYIGRRILLKGLRSYDVITKITLKKEKSEAGITYSRTAFACIGTLTKEQRAQSKDMAENIKKNTAGLQDVDEEDYNAPVPSTDSTDFQEVGNELPFN